VSFHRHYGRDIEKDGMVEPRRLRHFGGTHAQPDEGMDAVHDLGEVT